MSRHDPPAGQPPPPETPSRGIEVRLWSFVGGLVGLLLVCVVVGGVLFLTRDSSPTASASTTTLPTAPRGAVAGAPEVSVEVDETVLVVTLGADGYRPGDTYVVKTGETGEAARDDQHPLYVRDGSQELEIGVDPGRKQCVTAQLARENQRSSWSEVECEEAKG